MNPPELSSCAFPSVCQLHDGTIFASFKGAKTKGPYNKTDRAVVCISKDGGKTWVDALTVFDYGANTKGKQNTGMNDVWSEMAAFSTGHPFLKRMQNGTLWAYFYSGSSTHRTNFHVVKVEL